MELDVAESDEKLYTLILKDELLPDRPDGRERSSLSWQADLRVVGSGKVVVRWKKFRPTYRGKEVDDADPLDLKSIKRLGIMMRRYGFIQDIISKLIHDYSHFGSQSGEFNLSVRYIAAWKAEPEGDKNESVIIESKGSIDSENGKTGGSTCCAIL